MEGPAIDQPAGEGGAHGKVAGQAPQQPLRPAHPHGGHRGQQDIGQSQQGTQHPVDPLSTVVHLDLAAEAVNGAVFFGIGVLAVPLALVQGQAVGLGRPGGGAAGKPLAAALVVAAVELEQQGEEHHGAAGQLPVPVLGQGQLKGVGQGGARGQSQQSVHAEAAPQGAEQPLQQQVGAQKHPGPQQPGGDPNLDDILIQRGQPYQPQGGHQQLGQSGDAQQSQQHHPHPGGLQPAAEALGQLLGGRVRGRRLLPPGAGGRLLLRLLLPVSAGDQLLQTADLLLVGLLRLLKHVVGVLVPLAGYIFDKGGQNGLLLREGHHGGAVLLLPGGSVLLRRRVRCGRAAGIGGGRAGELHQLAPFLGPGLRLRPGQVGLHRNGGALGAAAGAEFCQNVIHGEAHVLRPLGQGLQLAQFVLAIRFFGVLIQHSRYSG